MVYTRKERLGWYYFWDKLTLQILRHKLRNDLYPSNCNFRDSTSAHWKRRRIFASNDNESAAINQSSIISSNQVSLQQLYEASILRRRRNKRRLCGNLDLLQLHINLTKKGMKSGVKYNVCRLTCFTKYSLCNTHLHYFLQYSNQTNQCCFIKHHNKSFLGLDRSD